MTRYIEDLNENTAPVAGDFLLCYDASAGSTDKDRKVNVSKFAVLAVANTFSADQTFTGQIVSGPASTGQDSLFVNMPASTSGSVLAAYYNSTIRHQILAKAALSVYRLNSVDLGSTHGPHVEIGRNTNAATAAGFLRTSDKSGTFHNSWVDAAGNWRVSSATLPTSANDTTGTVIGTQTSSLDSKDVIGEFVDYDGALAAILATPLHDFKYKSGAYNGERFTGIITDYAPIFGMDRDKEHPAGKSLNDITGFGYTVAAFKAQARQIGGLTRRIEELEGKLT